MGIYFTEKELSVLDKISKASEDLGIDAYLIGGFVRDKIIGRPTKDADIVCIGDGIGLANHVADLFEPRPNVSFFKNFGTAQIKIEDFEIEFVGARKESYRNNSRHPQVEAGTLVDDQIRKIDCLVESLFRETDLPVVGAKKKTDQASMF